MDKTIEYVLEVARCGGIARAARNLYITPSALSKFIIQREAELGVKLFAREGNKFTLTYPGERYVEMLQEEAQLQEKMHYEMARLSDLYSGRLRIGFQMSFAELMTNRILPTMQEEYPSVHFFIEESSTGDLMQMLKKSQLDVVLALSDEEDESLRYDRILKSPVVIAAARNSILGNKAENKEGFSHLWVDDETLINERIVFDRGEKTFRKYAGYLLGKGKIPLHSDITVTNARTALLCVEQGMGIIVLPELLVRELHYENKIDLFSFGLQERFTTLAAISDPKTVLANEVQMFGKIARDYLST